jgi:phosphoglycolate phosphatase
MVRGGVMMVPLPKPRAILFDWDNTLVDTWPLIHAALNMTLRFMEHPEWTLEKVRADVKQSMRDAFPEMFGDRWKEAASHYQASYRSIHLSDLQPLAGARETLESIPRAQVFVGLVSNKQGDTLRKELAHIGWAHYFDIAVGASDAARDKPHPDPVLFALKEYAIAPAPDVWFVGDTGVDLDVAQATGCTAILFGDHATEGAMHDGFPFAAHARDHAEMKALIQASCVV